MRVIHLSYARMTAYQDPNAWLNRINFFVALVKEMAKHTEVKSIHCINYRGILQKGGIEYHFLKLTRIQLMFPVGIHRYVKGLNPEIVLVHGLLFPWQALWLRWQLGDSVKIVIQHHAERPLRHYKRVLQKLVDPFISAYFFTSLDQAAPWVREKQIGSLHKVAEVMEVPSVFEPMEKNEAMRRTGLEGGGNYLWVGRLDANKDPITLVKAFIRFARMDNLVHLYMVFHGDELINEVKELLSASPGEAARITLVGTVEHSELLYWFNSVDFVISTSHYEGSGIAVCEAMSCGCIPILTNIPSFRVMTGNGSCGIIFTPGVVDDLCKALVNSTGIAVLSERKKVLEQYQQHLSAEAIAKKMVNTFQEILKNKK